MPNAQFNDKILDEKARRIAHGALTELEKQMALVSNGGAYNEDKIEMLANVAASVGVFLSSDDDEI